MISPFFMFLETALVWTAGATVAGLIDHWGRKRAANRVDLSGAKPEPALGVIWLQRLIALSMIVYPPYLMYRETTKAQAQSNFPPQPSSCRLKLGPYEKKWQC